MHGAGELTFARIRGIRTAGPAEGRWVLPDGSERDRNAKPETSYRLRDGNLNRPAQADSRLHRPTSSAFPRPEPRSPAPDVQLLALAADGRARWDGIRGACLSPLGRRGRSRLMSQTHR
jgi:hypothetical protein